MSKFSVSRFKLRVAKCALALLLMLPIAVSFAAAPAMRHLDLRGGPFGVATPVQGPALEGLMVQLISARTGIRTTVFTDPQGNYEFPKLAAGSYTLRIPRPLEFLPYVREQVSVNGANRLPDIRLERRSRSEFLPAVPEVIGQLTDAELLFNLPGTAYEKKVFSNNCGTGCHTYQWQFRARFDLRSWQLIVDRMLNYNGRILVGRRPAGTEIDPQTIATISGWLARVRGPDATDAPLKAFSRPHAPATNAVITEYELPRVEGRIHDVAGDAAGHIWYTSNRAPFLGKLDPVTGRVTEIPVPRTPGCSTGQHWIEQARDGAIWYSETWCGNLARLDPQSGKIRVMHTGLQGNMALAPDGYLWRTSEGAIHKFDPSTGKSVQQFPLKKTCSTYGNFMSLDGRYFGGGGWDPVCTSFDGIVFLDTKTGEVVEADSPSGVSIPSRGSFDPDGNIWAGGRGGVLVKFDRLTRQVSEYASPTPYNTFYETRADRNGDIWAGEMRAGRIARFRPRTGQWIEYNTPEPFTFDWQTWVDNNTDPVTVWYGDHYGYIVRLQLRDDAPAAKPSAVRDSSPAATAAQSAPAAAASDAYQRSTQVYTLNWFPGDDVERGKEIYFFKCWLCHNEYTTKENYPGVAPLLVDLHKRATLPSGLPVTDANISTRILYGSGGMPAFSADLTARQVEQVVAYLRSGRCCWDEGNAPKNPLYKAGP